MKSYLVEDAFLILLNALMKMWIMWCTHKGKWNKLANAFQENLQNTSVVQVHRMASWPGKPFKPGKYWEFWLKCINVRKYYWK